MKLREKICHSVSLVGIDIMSRIFPDVFMQSTLTPSDRFLEYNFATRHLPSPPARVLDVGCSGSYWPLILCAAGYIVDGIDPRAYPITNRLKFEGFNFIKQDILNFNTPEKYDACTAISTIEHIGIQSRYGQGRNIDGDKKAIDKIADALRPGGLLILTVPFGIAQVQKDVRIYDSKGIENLLSERFHIPHAECYAMDKDDNWFHDGYMDCERIHADSGRYALICVKAYKL